MENENTRPSVRWQNFAKPLYRHVLQAELQRRKDKNAQYSLRAFARDLAIDPADLSKALTGKKPISFKVGLKAIERLELTQEEQSMFLESITDEQKRSRLKNLGTEMLGDEPASEIEIDTFAIISEVFYAAILELINVEGFVPETDWIAGKLGITEDQVEDAIVRLMRVGLVKIENGALIRTDKMLTTKDKHLTTPALRKFQCQVLIGAMNSLEKDPIDIRSQTSMTMAIDPDKLAIAKSMIEDFTKFLSRYLESGQKKRVYQLSISLYPIQKE